MPERDAPFGHLSQGQLTRSGRVFVVVGTLLGVLAAVLLVVPLFSFVYVALSQTPLVQYASYMLKAQLIVHGTFAAILLVPSALLIQQGRKRVRAGGRKDN